MTSNIFQVLKFLVLANFIISVMLLITGSFLSLSDRYSLFEFNQDLYGELIINLKTTLIYLAITELFICAYCFFKKETQGFILAGFFLILMVGAIRFYGEINNVEIDENLSVFFLYTGVSHIIFGVTSSFKKTPVDNINS